MNNERNQDLLNADAKLLAEEAVKVLLEKLALDVSMFYVTEYTSVTDYYVNATGKSLTHVASLVDDVIDNFEERGATVNRVEGKKGNTWILADYGSLILNVFDAEGRSFYNFDRLLPVESRCDISNLVAEVDKKFNVKEI